MTIFLRLLEFFRSRVLPLLWFFIYQHSILLPQVDVSLLLILVPFRLNFLNFTHFVLMFLIGSFCYNYEIIYMDENILLIGRNNPCFADIPGHFNKRIYSFFLQTMNTRCFPPIIAKLHCSESSHCFSCPYAHVKYIDFNQICPAFCSLETNLPSLPC